MEPPHLKHQKLDIDEEDHESTSPFDMLPNEMAEIPIKMVMKSMNTQERYDFLVDVLPKVSRRFREIASRKSMWKGTSPFEMLPDNLAVIPIKMAFNGTHHLERTSFLVNDLARVSTRFQALSALKSLWRGKVEIYGRTQYVKQVIQHYVNDGTTEIKITPGVGGHPNQPGGGTGPATLSPDDISTLTAKCPKLRMFFLFSMNLELWTGFVSPWMSLKTLILVQPPDHLIALGYGISNGMFENIKLHHSLPNLEEFYIRAGCNNWVLPDMGQCKVLHTLSLGKGQYFIRGLPIGLKNLSSLRKPFHFDLNPVIINMGKESFKTKYEACEISDEVLWGVCIRGYYGCDCLTRVIA